MATTWGKPSLSMVARAAFLRSRKNAACSSGLSWICCRRLVAIRARPLSRAQVCRRGSKSMAESLAQVLPLGFPPLVQDRDVGADGEMADAHVEEVLRLIRGGDLGAGRHAHLDGRFEHAALHHS